MFIKRLINWVASWGGPMGTASGQQIPLPLAPIVDDTKVVCSDSALQISAVYACVELLSQTISTLPLHVYRTDSKGVRTMSRDSRLWVLLHDKPNAWMTPCEFLSAMVANRMLRGNAFAKVVRDTTGEPVALIPLSADQMEVLVDETGTTYRYYQDGKIQILLGRDVVHWKGLGNGFMGLSKLEYMRASANEAVNAQDNATKLYGKNSKPAGILQTESVLDDSQMKALKSRFNGMASSASTGLYVVDRGLKFTQLSLSPADAQLLETRKFTVEEICRWFGVPGVLVNASGQTTWGSGIEQIVEGFHKFTVAPLCKQLEQALSRCLIADDATDTTIEFKYEGFLRSTPQARADYYSKMVQNGAMTRNEVRRLENLPPVEGGDDLTAQSNLVPIDKLGELQRTGSSPKDGSPVRQ